MTILLIIIALVLVVLTLWLFKPPKIGNMVLITGGIKTGKTTLSVRTAYKTYKKNVRIWKIKKALGKVFKKLAPSNEKPCLYSNIPLRCPYVPLTTDLLERKTRFAYGSVCYICETSLVADSMSFKDNDVNERLLLFCKLFAHETKGGTLVLDTQSITDNHYAIKRCLSTYLHIYKTLKFPLLPFIIMFYEELFYSEDGTRINVRESDVTDCLHWCVVPKSTWKLFDRYCYSVLTDKNKVENAQKMPHKRMSLKANKIISFKKYKSISEEFLENEK